MLQPYQKEFLKMYTSGSIRRLTVTRPPTMTRAQYNQMMDMPTDKAIQQWIRGRNQRARKAYRSRSRWSRI